MLTTHVSLDDLCVCGRTGFIVPCEGGLDQRDRTRLRMKWDESAEQV